MTFPEEIPKVEDDNAWLDWVVTEHMDLLAGGWEICERLEESRMLAWLSAWGEE